MEIIETDLEGLYIIKPKIYSDERGYFMESFKQEIFEKKFPDIRFIQDNESKSSYGVLRGLHFQKAPFEQTKLVRVITGEVIDVVVDLRKGSRTYGEYRSFILSEINKTQLLIPKGLAHGYAVLSKEAIFAYKVDNFYSPEHENGINYSDPYLSIDWKIPKKEIIVSKKDSVLKNL